jgi:DNA-binding MarR family transcriptional regulator
MPQPPARRAESLDTDDVPSLGSELDFLRVLWALDHALARTSKRMLATLGVTGPQRLVLRVVGRFPRISAGHLASTLHLHPSTMTGLVRRLEARGLLRRWSDPRDARKVLLGLTPAGHRLDVQAAGTVEAAVDRVLSQVSPARVDAARSALREIANALMTADPSGATPARRRRTR